MRAQSLGKSAWVQIPALPLTSCVTWASSLTSQCLIFLTYKTGIIIAPASLDPDRSSKHLDNVCNGPGTVLRAVQGHFN